MTAAKPKPTAIPDLFAAGDFDGIASVYYGIYDRLTDWGHSTASVVVAPAAEDGAVDFERASPINLEQPSSDSGPADMGEARRWAILVDEIDGCDAGTSMLLWLDPATGNPSMAQIAGPDLDADIAMRIIGRDIGAAAPPKEYKPGPIAESLAKLAAKPEPVAANDNKPGAHSDLAARLTRLQRQFGGSIMSGEIYGAKVGDKSGRIYFAADGSARLHTHRGIFEIIEDKPIAATPFSLGDPAEIPERDWLYGKHYIRRYATASVGPGGGGKTAHSISEALSMVTGRPLLDPEGGLFKPLRVWWVNAEDPVDEINRRFHGAAKHFNVTNDQIGGRLFTDSGRDQSFVIARQEGRDLKIVEPFVEDIVSEIRRREIDVVIIDPFVSTHEAQENDNGAMQRVAAAWVRVADEANCCVELVHHVAKNQGEVTADSARGGGAFKDKVRSMRVFNVMTHAEAEKAGVEDPRAYFRLDHGKVNMIASGRSQWRRFVSVPLGNGKGIVKTGDEIGVVEAWRWPSADVLADLAAEERQAAVANVPEQTLAGLKVRLNASDYKADQRAKYWAGNLLVELGVAIDKDQAKAMLAAWIEAGELEIVRKKDASRHEADFIKPVAGI
ncbi:hypothetical protein ABID08_006536 [Rhizobium binae]|uniref:AAA family ATPase n=1 Tax=Rhizobium binae TaxID=1138190 RepID=A0ABV2MUD1_9HYPH|nr:AAA family ATPase [Rhizobium binae]MBX4993846.1 AAA family ATPase [Rhizobium binae]QSY83276.1 AAA family ATPase [Rhizobium binae]